MLSITSFDEEEKKEFQKKKELYSYITQPLQAMGHNFNVTQIEIECKTLLAAYQRHVNDQSQTGKEKRSLEFKRIQQNPDTGPKVIMGTTDSSEEDESKYWILIFCT